MFILYFFIQFLPVRILRRLLGFNSYSLPLFIYMFRQFGLFIFTIPYVADDTHRDM